MLAKTAIRIIIHEKEKFSGAVAGVTLAIFLMVLQGGFYLGFKRDTTIVLDSVDADVWIIPRHQPLFDGWMAIDDMPYWRAQQHKEIDRVGRLVWGYAPSRIPGTGGVDTVQVLGLEFESGIGLDLKLPEQNLKNLLRADGHVLVGEKDREKLGIDKLNADGMEISGRRATAVGFVDDIHLFTTAGFILTSLDNGRAFLRVPPSQSTYVVCKCRPGADVAGVARRLRAEMPEHDVLTKAEFHDRAAAYWATRTGIGPVLMLSAGLAALVGFLIVMLAIYVSTIEKIPIFACLKALGASNGEIVTILVVQVSIVFLVGGSLAGLGLYAAILIVAHTTLSLLITAPLVLGGLGATAFVSAASSLLSIRKLIGTDPGEAFRT